MNRIVFIIFCFTLYNCSEADRLTAQDSFSIQEEAIVESYFTDVGDMLAWFSENALIENGRVATDARLTCASVTWQEGSSDTQGVVTIDFSDNVVGHCTTNGVKREGKLIIAYSNGPSTNVGYKVRASFEDYHVNGVELLGMYTSELTQRMNNTVIYSVKLEGGEALWSGSDDHIKRNATLQKTWRLGASPELSVTGTAEGTSKNGKNFTMRILEPIVYKEACRISENLNVAVQGVKIFTHQHKNIFIDFGDGSCDAGIAVTVNGNTRNVNIF